MHIINTLMADFDSAPILLLTDGTIIESVNDAIAIGSKLVESAKNEVAWLIPRPTLACALQYNIVEKFKVRIQSGLCVRGIVDCSTRISIYYRDCWTLVRICIIPVNIRGYS